MMPTLGFNPERDNDRLVASFSGGWQMRIGLGKILLQEPDLLLLVRPALLLLMKRRVREPAFLRVDAACVTQHGRRADARCLQDEPTNHLDVEAIEWLEQYLKSVDVRALLARQPAPRSPLIPLEQVPMVIVSHDREFLDQLCTKIVEVERGVVRAMSCFLLSRMG